MRDQSPYSVYIVRCRDGSLYTGIAIDVERRLAEHVDGNKGAKYLRGKGPLQLVFQQEIGDRSLATRVEHRIKQLSREEKMTLTRMPAKLASLVDDIAGQ